MISILTGTLVEKQLPHIVIDVHGVGYEVDVSLHTFYALPAAGESVRLYTHLLVREDANLLYGFADKAERTAFRTLIKVGGIGAKTALGILSAMTAGELAQAVAAEDVKRLSAAPGIGKKTAERMILELRGKLAAGPESQGSLKAADGMEGGQPDSGEDAVSALMALGYTEREARSAVKNIPAGTDTGEAVRLALKNLMK